MKKLKFTKGTAVVLLSEEMVADEYSVSQDRFEVEVYAKTQAAIKRIGKLVGELKISKDMIKRNCEILKNKEKNFVIFRLFVDGNMLNDLYFECGSIWYHQSGYRIDYRNAYSDEHYAIRVPVTRSDLKKHLKEPNFKRVYENGWYGSVANGCPLKNIIDSASRKKDVIREI